MAKVALVELEPGKLVSYQGKTHRIRRIDPFDRIELLDDDNQAVVIANIEDLQPATLSTEQTHTDLQAIDDKA